VSTVPLRRRLLVPGLLTLTGLAILLSLGVWQMQRKTWKEALVATLERRLAASAVDLPDPASWPKLTQADHEFTRVKARVSFADARPAWVYTGTSQLRPDVKGPGYFVFVLAKLPGGETIVIDAGFTPQMQHPPLAGTAEITGFLRWPEKPGLFVADHDASGDTWFVRDHLAMARTRGWGPVAPFYIDLESPTPVQGLPKPGPITVHLRNDHLGYALTWFGLAAVLAAVFGVWVGREWYDKTAKDT
jgi:cytochrome oxidase assembly protein ShyY1